MIFLVTLNENLNPSVEYSTAWFEACHTCGYGGPQSSNCRNKTVKPNDCSCWVDGGYVNYEGEKK